MFADLDTFSWNAEARSILNRLEAADAERHAKNKARFAQVRELKAQRVALQRDKAHLENFRYETQRHGAAPDDSKAKANIKAINTKLRRIDEQIDLHESQADEPTLSYARVQHELEKIGNALDLVEPVERPAIELQPDERSAADALPRLRAVLYDLYDERRKIETAALPAAQVKAVCREEITRLAARGQPRTLSMFTGQRGIDWPTIQTGPAVGANIPRAVDGAALVCFLLKDALIEKIDELVDVNAGAFPNALSPDKRKKMLAAVASKIDAAERLEAACVEQIIANGGIAHHRPDANVLAVLSYAIAE